MVLDESTGTEHVLRRGELHELGSSHPAPTVAQRNAEQYTDFADRVVPEGSFAAHEMPKNPPHRK